MMCLKNGECMMNLKDKTGINFCASPTCISPRKERMVIADKIAKILKSENLTEAQEKEVLYLKNLYASSLKKEVDCER